MPFVYPHPFSLFIPSSFPSLSPTEKTCSIHKFVSTARPSFDQLYCPSAPINTSPLPSVARSPKMEGSSNGSRFRSTHGLEEKPGKGTRTTIRQFVAEDVDKKADDFIKNFRKQLKIEREESIKRRRSDQDSKHKNKNGPIHG